MCKKTGAQEAVSSILATLTSKIPETVRFRGFFVSFFDEFRRKLFSVRNLFGIVRTSPLTKQNSAVAAILKSGNFVPEQYKMKQAESIEV